MLALPGNNFKILRADNVFPEPDSPTIATVLPFGISIFTLLTTFWFASKLIVNFFIETSLNFNSYEIFNCCEDREDRKGSISNKKLKEVGFIFDSYN